MPAATRIIGCIVFIFLSITSVKADHITGGEMFYTSSVNTDGTIQYSVTLKLFMRCSSGRQFNNPAVVSIFNRVTHARITNINVNLSNEETVSLKDAGPCVTNPPLVCYVIGTYRFDVALAPSADGYLLGSQVNFRISGIANLERGYSNIGATYTSEIPGFDQVANGPANSSAKFIGSDLVVVCANNRFSYSFAASDPDGDLLRYSFCNAYVSGSASFNNNSVPPPNPPYSSVPYGAAFGGSAPLGSQVKIDSKTGLITGTAPPTGVYVVTVCVEEMRNGVVIATQRKDLQIAIAACDIAAAQLEPEYQLCRNTKTITLTNLSASVLIRSQNWEITSAAGTRVFETTGNNISYTFADTGLFTIRLVINRGLTCSDSTIAIARVYPGFVPAFSSSGICFNRPTTFVNKSTTVYGSIQAYHWDFGDVGLQSDTSNLANPNYTYNSMGQKFPVLTAVNTNGCRDTAKRVVAIFDKPPLNFAFKDTLICNRDSVQLSSAGNGILQWSPSTFIINSNTASPTVFPKTTTVYYATLNDEGCINRDSVRIRVTDKVNLVAMQDTIICQGDAIQLKRSFGRI